MYGALTTELPIQQTYISPWIGLISSEVQCTDMAECSSYGP